jgi:hypothetical protein
VPNRQSERSGTWVAESRPRVLTNAAKNSWKGLTVYRSIPCQPEQPGGTTQLASGSVLAARIRVQQPLFRFRRPVAEGPVEGLDHQSGIRLLVERPSGDTAAEQVDSDSQVPQAGFGAGVGDVPGPAAVWSRGLEVLLQLGSPPPHWLPCWPWSRARRACGSWP